MQELLNRLGSNHDGSTLLSQGYFDVVVALDVLEHIEDDVAALSVLRECVKPGGKVIVTVPAMPSLWSTWDDQLGHHRRYTRRMMERTAVAAGMEIAEVSFMFPELYPVGLLRKYVRAGSTDSADFPVFPRRLDILLGAISQTTSRARRVTPFGSSIFAVLRRPLRDFAP